MHTEPSENFDGTLPDLPQPAVPSDPKPIGNLAAALSKAQGEIKAPVKNRAVDFTNNKGQRVKYNYADLADVIDCIRAPLAKHGLSIVHQLEYSQTSRGAGYGLTTSLLHASGERITTWYPLPDPAREQIRAQEFGSALTYARRYSLSSLVGIASEEDDDGAEAAPAGRQTAPAARPAPNPAPTQSNAPLAGANARPQVLSTPQLTRLFAIAGQRGWSNEDVKTYIGATWHIESSKDLSRLQYEQLIHAIETMAFEEAIKYAIK